MRVDARFHGDAGARRGLRAVRRIAESRAAAKRLEGDSQTQSYYVLKHAESPSPWWVCVSCINKLGFTVRNLCQSLTDGGAILLRSCHRACTRVAEARDALIIARDAEARAVRPPCVRRRAIAHGALLSRRRGSRGETLTASFPPRAMRVDAVDAPRVERRARRDRSARSRAFAPRP